MKVGIVGLPNAGKSTLFNALTKGGAQTGDYPFTTIEPNVAMTPLSFDASPLKSCQRFGSTCVNGLSSGHGAGSGARGGAGVWSESAMVIVAQAAVSTTGGYQRRVLS